MKNLLQDLRYGIRLFIRKPAFTSVIVLTLALGIGAITTIFSIINAVLIRPLPYKDSERLVMIWDVNVGKGVSQDQVSPGNLIDLRDQSRVFEEVAAFASTNFTFDEGGLVITAPGQPNYSLAPGKGERFELKNTPGYGVEFVATDRGKITSAIVYQPNGAFKLDKVT